MNHMDWVLANFDVKQCPDGRIAFKTPSITYVFVDKKEWEAVKEKLNKV